MALKVMVEAINLKNAFEVAQYSMLEEQEVILVRSLINVKL
jgi:hypothetical protein